MHTYLNRMLAVITALIVAVDIIWVELGHFDIDARNYALLFLVVPPIVGASYYYSGSRNEPAMGTMLAAAAFLIVFPTACCLLSYLMLTITGPRIDGLLAHIDHAMGFSWPALMTFAANHLLLTYLLKLTYLSVMPQTVLLLFLLGWKKDSEQIYRLCFALASSALVTILIWTAFPAFGAFSVFSLPSAVASKLGLALDGNYGKALVHMLNAGPGFISPRELRGLVGFPSYHTVQALLLIWYARNLPYLRWLSLVLNSVVLFAVPIHGGHHLIDMFGGGAVTIFSVILAGRIVAFAVAKKAEGHPYEAQLIPAAGAGA